MVTTNAVRFPFANLLALVLMGCFFMILFGVTINHRVVIDRPHPAPIIFAPLLHETEIIDDHVKPPPPRYFPPPEVPNIPREGPGPGVVTVVPPEVVFDPTPFAQGRVDSAEAPLLRINPDYPRRAVAAHVEGWVQLQFTVAPSGAVSDVVVIDADPKGVFDDAATKAVSRWKYAPKILDGRAVERRGLQVVLRFNLD